MKKQTGFTGRNNYGNKNKAFSKILLITMSVIAVILTITFSVIIIIKALDSEGESVTQTKRTTKEFGQQDEIKPQPGEIEEPEGGPYETDIAVEDTITLGTYEQDNDSSNGKEPIKWRVLAIEGKKALVISEYGLDCKPYHEEYEAITWRDCSLRAWLNNEFYDEAFSNADKKRILKEKVIAEDNSEYGTDAGEDTEDYVFLLSASEAENYFRSTKDRACKPTAYAVRRGVVEMDVSSYDASWWLLRTPGSGKRLVARVSYTGDVRGVGEDVNKGISAVRPAIWINL